MFNEMFNNNPKFTYNADNNTYIGITDFLKDHDKMITYQVHGMFVTKNGKYGPSGIVILDGFNLRVPKHIIKAIEAIRNDTEAVRLVNEGHCGLKFREYDDKNGVTRMTVDFVDV